MSLIDAIRKVRRTPPRFEPDGDPGPTVPLAGKKVLLVYLFPALGDAILIGPVAKALLDQGAAKVSLLVRKNAARILKTLDLPLELLILPDDLAVPAADLATAKGALKASLEKLEAQLEKKGFDVAVDLTFRADHDARRWVITSQAPVRLGWCAADEDADATGLSHGTPDVRHQAERHWSRYQLLPMRGLGLTRPSYDLPFTKDPKAEAEADRLYGQKPRRVLLIPGARQEARRFPSEGFEAIGRAALEHRAQLVIVGAPEENALIKALQKTLGSGVQSYTKKDLPTLVSLVRQADVVITNDTGPMHLAFLMDRPTIAIFTYMSPVCWGPPHPSPRAVVLNANAGALDSARIGMYTRAVIQDLERLLPRRP